MTDGDQGIDATLPDDTVREMVAILRPEWTVDAVERSPHGTDFVAFLDLGAPSGSDPTDAPGDSGRVDAPGRSGGTDAPDRAVLKATTADLVPATVARAEPRLLDLVGRETGIPVPEVYGVCERHDEFPAPFYLLEHVEGEVFEGPPPDLGPAIRERIVRDAGTHLAALHDLGPLEAYGRLGVAGERAAEAGDATATGGELRVVETDDHERYGDPREATRAVFEPAIAALEDGTWFPERADDPDRFADLVPELREWVAETIPAMPEPDPPTYNHSDYRYGNLLVDPRTGAIEAVLDWANSSAADPAYGLATAESLLLTPDRDSATRTAALREAFRTAYVDAREDWAFTDARRERIEVYRLAKRLDAMACLSLWYEDATPAERDERAAEHRAFVRGYLER